jgi:hypothetical protein
MGVERSGRDLLCGTRWEFTSRGYGKPRERTSYYILLRAGTETLHFSSPEQASHKH